MLSNQISSKDLFGYPMRHNGSIRETNDSSMSCSQGNSQFMNSQTEFSQLMFQDSQMVDSQSQSDSDGRRMLQKYMSKGSLFKSDGQYPSTAMSNQSKAQAHQQFLQNQKAKAKERDERDLLRSIMSVVNDSTMEVRQALQTFTESLQNKQGKTEQSLTSSFEKLSHEVTKSCEKVIDSIVKHDSTKEGKHELERELAQKDAIISSLEKQLKEHQMRHEHKMIEMLKDCQQHQQEVLEEKLQKLLNVTSEQLKLYDKQVSWQSEQESDQRIIQKDTLKEQQAQLKRLEEKLLTEMSKLQRDFEEKQDELGNFYKQQFQESQRRQSMSVENHMQHSLVAGLRQASRDTSSMFNQQQQDIEATCTRHRQELEHFVKQQLSKQLAEYDQKIKEVVQSIKCAESVEDKVPEVTKKPVGKAYSDGMWVTLPLRSPKPNVTNALDSDNKASYRCDFESITIKSPEFQVTSSYSRSSIPRSTSTLFTSPWNSKALFGKHCSVKPSPVATVSPMMQNKEPKALEPPKDPSPQFASKPKTRKQRGIVQPQRRSQRISVNSKDRKDESVTFQEETNRANQKSYSSKVDMQRTLRDENQSNVYDFNDERDVSCQGPPSKRKSLQWTNTEPDWLKMARYHNNTQGEVQKDSSGESSPSISMMEVVVKRRVKCERTPQINRTVSRHEQWRSATQKTEDSRDKESFDDLLSTPCFRSYEGLDDSTQSLAPVVWKGKMSRKQSGKRKLCDLNYDTQITEITQSIKQHLQRVKPRC